MSVADSAGAAGAAGERKTFLGHPRGLVVLFLAEMWERFSYYGMRAILVFYLTWHFLFERDLALTLYGAYVALVYLGPLLGGYLADKYIGFRKAVIFGGLMLVAGHGLMGVHGAPADERLVVDGTSYEITRDIFDFEGQTARTIHVGGTGYPVADFVQPEEGSEQRVVAYTDASGDEQVLTGAIERVRNPFNEQILFLALALIVAGVGFLKPNISTCVGALYDKGDRRRDPGFTLYYMGINLGAFLSSVAVPILAANYGWAFGFGAAAVGMVAGLVIFVLFQGELEGRADPPAEIDQKAPAIAGLTRPQLVYLSGALFVIAAYGLLQIAAIMSMAMHVVVLGLITPGILYYMVTKLDRVERDRMIGLLILILSSILFWTLFDQGPSSLNLFAAAHVTNEIGGWQFPAAVLQSANPLFILIFAIPVAMLWTWLGSMHSEPNVFIKFAFAMFQIGAGYFVLNLGIATAGAPGPDGAIRISVIFILLMYLLHTTGELFLSPVGLSAVTKLAVPHLVGFMMGYWFVASAYANIIAAIVARATQVPEGTASAESIASYSGVYAQLGFAALVLGGVLLIASPFLRKLTHEPEAIHTETTAEAQAGASTV